MREIKFRAWDIREKRMVKQFLPDWNNIDQKRYLLMQYTGLKDKNEKEIYEGDVVIRRAYEYPNDPREKLIETVCGVVVWSTYFIAFRIDTEPNNEEGPQDDYEYIEGSNTILEVIGNISENPELLEPPKNPAKKGGEE